MDSVLISFFFFLVIGFSVLSFFFLFFYRCLLLFSSTPAMLYEKKVKEAFILCSDATACLRSHPHYSTTPLPVLRTLYEKLRDVLPCLSLLCAFAEDKDRTRSSNQNAFSSSSSFCLLLPSLSKVIKHILSFLPSLLETSSSSVNGAGGPPLPLLVDPLSSFFTRGGPSEEGGTLCASSSAEEHARSLEVMPFAPYCFSSTSAISLGREKRKHDDALPPPPLPSFFLSQKPLLQEDVFAPPLSISSSTETYSSPPSAGKIGVSEAITMRCEAGTSAKDGVSFTSRSTLHPTSPSHFSGNVKEKKWEGKKNSRLAMGWDLVIGCEEAKTALKQCTILPRVFPQLFLHRRPLQRILLYGPPGTGKTLLAQAVAEVNQQPLLSFSAADLLSQWVGESEKHIQSVFQQAASFKNAILFFDEIDALCGKRGGSEESESARRIKTQFLLQLQSLPPTLTLVAASNLPWEIDMAIRRRFDRLIYVGVPDHSVRCTLMERALEGIPHCLTNEDITRLSTIMNGFTASDVVLVTEQAMASPLQALVETRAVRLALPEDWENFGMLSANEEKTGKEGQEQPWDANPFQYSSSSFSASCPSGQASRVPPSASAGSPTESPSQNLLPFSASSTSLLSSLFPSIEATSLDQNKVFFVPCTENDPLALLSVRPEHLHASQLLLRLVCPADFHVVLESFIPSVTEESVQIFKNWKSK